jgi:putative membrane protein
VIVGHVSFSRTLLGLWRPLTGVAAWSLAVTAAHHLRPDAPVWIAPMPLTLAGVALGVILTFRNNAVYERYWEGRILWGRLVNASRTFVRQLVTFLRADEGAPDAAEREAFLRETMRCAAAFPHALRHGLRGEDPSLELMELLSAEEVARVRRLRNVPAGVLMLLGERVGAARRRGWADPIAAAQFDDTLTELATIQGGCERIRNTPLPPVYTHIAHRVVALYCGLLPFGLARDLGPVTPAVVLLIAFAFLLLSRITLLLENPFGLRANDLPLTALSRMIEADLRQSLGEEKVPPPVEPERGILL